MTTLVAVAVEPAQAMSGGLCKTALSMKYRL